MIKDRYTVANDLLNECTHVWDNHNEQAIETWEWEYRDKEKCVLLCEGACYMMNKLERFMS